MIGTTEWGKGGSGGLRGMFGMRNGVAEIYGVGSEGCCVDTWSEEEERNMLRELSRGEPRLIYFACLPPGYLHIQIFFTFASTI